MNVSYRWLQAIAPGLDLAPDDLSDHLAARGFPIEGVKPLAEGLDGIVVARVVASRPHPNADRLTLCEVDGGDGVVQVVCGAPNVEEGAWYPFAPVGAELPGGMEIRKVKLRGEASVGMLCSEHELGLGPSADGIMLLEGEFTPGQPFVEALGLNDLRLEVEVTPNRPDLLSVRGVARESAAEGEAGLVQPGIPGEDPAVAETVVNLARVTDSEEAEGAGVRIRIEAPERCGRYLGLVVEGVEVGPSPRWLQNRLRAVGARPINNVVDATNYVLLELGQPLHAFDLDRLAEHTVVVRTAREGETLVTLDGAERKLTPEMLAICDAERPIALAGVMGGEDSEVTDSTTRVLLECALFTPGPIRATRKAVGLSTDASYRFERGVDPEGMDEALRRAARIIVATAGGEARGPIVEALPQPFQRPRVELRPARVEKVLGVAFAPERIRELLTPLGFEVGDVEGEHLPVQVPGHRSWDVTREVDLIEEIARVHGYDAFPSTLAAYRPGTVPDDELFLLQDRLRDRLTADGLLEAQTPAFAAADEGEVELLNPISAEEGFLRRRLLPGLLRRVEYNLARGNRDVRLFELGTAFAKGPEGELPAETSRLAIALTGARTPPHWSGDAAPFDLWDAKAFLERVGRTVTGTEEGAAWKIAAADDSGIDRSGPGALPLDPSATFTLLDAGGSAWGWGGRVTPEALDLPRWAGEVWGIEVVLPDPPPAREAVLYRPLPQHPGIDRDLALLIPAGRTVAEVQALLSDGGGEHFRGSRVFDLYVGEGVPEGFRSVAVRLHFRAADRTLRDADVDGVVRNLTRSLKEELGVELRGSEG